jgi:hypothetical protein
MIYYLCCLDSGCNVPAPSPSIMSDEHIAFPEAISEVNVLLESFGARNSSHECELRYCETIVLDKYTDMVHTGCCVDPSV